MTSLDDPRMVRASDFPAHRALTDQLRFLLHYAALAPSGHNTQPWLFKVGRDAVEVLADRTRGLPVVDPHDRELTISCGAAVGFLEVAARRFGLQADVTLPPADGVDDVLARITVSPGASPTRNETALFEAMAVRRTNRTAYGPEPVPQDVLAECAGIAAAHGVTMAHATDAETRSTVAALVADGDRRQFADPAFRRELASWVRSSRLGSRDGLSPAGFGMPDVLAPVARLIIRALDLGNSVAAQDAQKLEQATPALLLVATAADAANAWINAGRALSRILLLLTARGFAAAFLNQPVETGVLRPELADAFGVEGYPQILLRTGRPAEDVLASPRRPLGELVLAGPTGSP